MLRLYCTFFVNLLTSAEKRKSLCNIIKTTNAITLVKTILEIPYKVLQIL